MENRARTGAGWLHIPRSPGRGLILKFAYPRQVRYRDAGVDIDEADRAVAFIKKSARTTFTRGVLTDIGSFGAAYLLNGFRQAGAESARPTAWGPS